MLNFALNPLFEITAGLEKQSSKNIKKMSCYTVLLLSKATMLRITKNMSGERFLFDSSAKEIHDLRNEKFLCQISDIIEEGNEQGVDSLIVSRIIGNDECPFCIGQKEVAKKTAYQKMHSS